MSLHDFHSKSPKLKMLHLLTTVILGGLCKKNRVQTEFVVDKYILGNGFQFSYQSGNCIFGYWGSCYLSNQMISDEIYGHYFIRPIPLVTSCRLVCRLDRYQLIDLPHAPWNSGENWQTTLIGRKRL